MATSAAKTVQVQDEDEFISADQVVVSPRGRKAEYDDVLGAKLAKLGPNQGLVLKSFGMVPKNQRQNISGVIRKNWKHVRPTDEAKIDYSPEGFAQVRIKAAKQAASE